jgi:hypothetical protein
MSASKRKQKVPKNVDELDESDLELFSQSYLDELLEKAKAAYQGPAEEEEQEEDILTLEKDGSEYEFHGLDGKSTPHYSRLVSQGASASARGTETIANTIPCKRRG